MFDIGEAFPEADQRTQVQLKLGPEMDFRFQRSFSASPTVRKRRKGPSGAVYQDGIECPGPLAHGRVPERLLLTILACLCFWATQDLKAQTALTRMLRAVQTLQFVVVSEAEGRTPVIVGEASVDLRDVRDLGDIVDKTLPVIDPKRKMRVGTLAVTVIAQAVLRLLPA